MTRPDLKSLAHPDWPYAGSPHEWRGFVQDERPLKNVPITELADLLVLLGEAKRSAIYQKQNFGPDLT